MSSVMLQSADVAFLQFVLLSWEPEVNVTVEIIDLSTASSRTERPYGFILRDLEETQALQKV